MVRNIRCSYRPHCSICNFSAKVNNSAKEYPILHQNTVSFHLSHQRPQYMSLQFLLHKKILILLGVNLGLVVIDFQSIQIAIWMVQINPHRPDRPGTTTLVDPNPDPSGRPWSPCRLPSWSKKQLLRSKLPPPQSPECSIGNMPLILIRTEGSWHKFWYWLSTWWMWYTLWQSDFCK